MAINDVFNGLTYGGVNSLDYGIYITGAGVFNAPERAVEFVEIPGRNGSLDLDEGYWRNIEVTYTAGTFATSQEEFSEKLGAFRNAILSQKGYRRLTDTYNPDEYRLGLYASGLSVDALAYNQAGEFELVFNCKPQRYLISGETELTIESGAVINNPTLYEASPLLKVSGSGYIYINAYRVGVEFTPLGTVELLPRSWHSETGELRLELPPSLIVDGDEIRCSMLDWVYKIFPTAVADKDILQFVISNVTGSGFRVDTDMDMYLGQDEIFYAGLRNLVWTKGFPDTKGATVTAETPNGDFSLTISIVYDGDSIITLGAEISQTGSQPFRVIERRVSVARVSAESHQARLIGAYIDTEIGEAYLIEDGQKISVDNFVILGAELPKLPPGNNVIEYADTITEVKIIPRWWQL